MPWYVEVNCKLSNQSSFPAIWVSCFKLKEPLIDSDITREYDLSHLFSITLCEREGEVPPSADYFKFARESRTNTPNAAPVTTQRMILVEHVLKLCPSDEPE